MSRPKTTDKLPDSEEFWNSVDNDATKDFHNALLLDMIRSYRSHDQTDMIEFIAKIKLVVDLMDSPAEIFLSHQRSKLIDEEQKLTSELLADD